MDQSTDSLFDAVLLLETKHDCEELFETLLTPQELLKIVNRWRVFPLLEQGLPQRYIAKQLHLSLGTVSRANRTLTYGGAHSRHILTRLYRPMLSTG
jgi:TrpR-related protein YerC/YecD